jgi:predicted HTH domain antitoxin
VQLSKQQLKKELQLFLADKDRGISIKNFCELAGISERLFQYVVRDEKMPMTEATQRGLNRAYQHWKEGRIRVMKKHTNETYPDYRKEPKQPLMPMSKLVMTSEGFKVQNKPINRHDYANFGNILLKT